MGALRVIAVHGTFVRRAKWFAPGSPLHNELAELAGANLKPLELGWAGSNSHNARKRGAGALQQLILSEIPREQPGFIVAHSHGGNVAFMAASDPEVSCRIAGIVTVATPFITSGPRIMESVGRLVSMGIMAAMINLAAYFLKGAILASEQGLKRLFLALAGGIVALGLLCAVVWAITNLGAWLHVPERLDRMAQRRALRRLKNKQREGPIAPDDLRVVTPDVPVCVVYDEYDRVPKWLRAMRFMRRTPMAILGPDTIKIVTAAFFVAAFIWGHWGPGAWLHEAPLVVTDEAIRTAAATPNPGGAGHALLVMSIAKNFPVVPRIYAMTVTLIDHSALALVLASLAMIALVAVLEAVHLVTGILFGAAPWAYGTLNRLGLFGPWLTDFDISQLPIDPKRQVHVIPVVAPDVFRHSPLFDAATCAQIRLWIEHTYAQARSSEIGTATTAVAATS